jgi:RNA polymerase sigma-70 factor (ECF subfamily)
MYKKSTSLALDSTSESGRSTTMTLPVDPGTVEPGPNDLDDDQLVRRVLEGDRDAFTLLFHRHDPFIRRVILHIVRNQQDMEDVAVSTWIKVWDKLSTLRDGSKFRPWLTKIARNKVRDHLRGKCGRDPCLRHGQELREEGSSDEEDEKLVDPEDIEDRVATAIAFEGAWEVALKKMRPEQKKCLIFHLQGWKIEAIVERLGLTMTKPRLTEGTVRTYISEAYRILHEEFRKRLDGDQNDE